MSKRKQRAEQIAGQTQIPPNTRAEYVLPLNPRVPDFEDPKPAPVPLGEFSAPEFSIEPVRGARSFDVDKLGRLRGVSYDQVWTPGENRSVCRAMETISLSIQQYITAFPTLFGASVSPQTMRYYMGSDQQKKTAEPHPLPGCKCGFYGYYDGSNDYYKPERVSAVIEGYGEVVIGTRGFRATKARIVALTIPDTVTLATRIRHNYRDIPAYDTFAAMVAAHPTDTVAGPTPETDPDFWTRSAP